MSDPKAIPVDANLRPLLAAALQRSGGSLTLTHLELGEAAIASYRAGITVEHTDDGAIFRLVEKPEASRG
ncbi:hypothetical protein [Actinoallomurus sp. CA-142502]|uniref:hypothetical protein n=1 Tax=Actinoallomurus sp. CA-142502 TaxID=3239885 RepID=UPI003D8C49FC